MATKVHTLAWHKTQFDHSKFKNKTAVHKEAQRRRDIEVRAKKAETDAAGEEKQEKKKVKHNRRYKPKFTSMYERRYAVATQHTHKWCGGSLHLFGCKGTGMINGMRHSRCKGEGVIRIRQVGRRRPATGNVTTSGSKWR